jgi:hypothetical protein
MKCLLTQTGPTKHQISQMKSRIYTPPQSDSKNPGKECTRNLSYVTAGRDDPRNKKEYQRTGQDAP